MQRAVEWNGNVWRVTDTLLHGSSLDIYVTISHCCKADQESRRGGEERGVKSSILFSTLWRATSGSVTLHLHRTISLAKVHKTTKYLVTYCLTCSAEWLGEGEKRREGGDVWEKWRKKSHTIIMKELSDELERVWKDSIAFFFLSCARKHTTVGLLSQRPVSCFGRGCWNIPILDLWRLCNSWLWFEKWLGG